LDVNSSTGNFRISGKDVNWYSTQTAVGNDPVRINSYRSREGGAVVDNDNLFWHLVYGHDGTDYNTIGGAIKFVVDGTVATDKMPTEILFQTAEGASASDLSTKMIITPAGNVGIGNATPGEKLEVGGNVKITGDGAGGLPLVIDTNADASSETGLDVTVGDNADNRIAIFRNRDGYEAVTVRTSDNVAGYIDFTNPSSVVTARLSGDTSENSFFNAGNLGIGTTNPGAKLDVVGTFRVNTTGYGESLYTFTGQAVTNDMVWISFDDDEWASATVFVEWAQDTSSADNGGSVVYLIQAHAAIVPQLSSTSYQGHDPAGHVGVNVGTTKIAKITLTTMNESGGRIRAHIRVVTVGRHLTTNDPIIVWK